MNFAYEIFLTLFSATISWLILKISIPFFQREFLDKPNNRSSHKKPIPSGGGIVFVIIAFISNIYYIYKSENIILYPTLALPLALVGLVDDKKNINSFLRYLVQILTVFSIFAFNNKGFLEILNNIILNNYLTLFLILIILLIGTAIINFINFMDGIDGLVSGCFIVILFSYSWTNDNELLALNGALIGFLILNWHPAKVFMGDVGSTYLGAIYFGIILNSPSFSSAIGLILISTPLIGDAFFCIIRRLIIGQNIFQAHNLHLYQRLSQAGWSHSRISKIYITSTIFIAISFLNFGLFFELVVSLGVIIFGIYLDKRKAIPITKSIAKVSNY